MARVKFYTSGDIIDPQPSIGEATYWDSGVLVVESFDGTTDYFGRFTYPNGRWAGTITSILDYDDFGRVTSQVTGLNIDTRYATAGPAMFDAFEVALARADNIDGSNFADKLRAYDGNDTIFGRAGNDVIFGDNGADRVYGGTGGDAIYGGTHGDWLSGGIGNDILTGGPGSDRFVFALHEGRDRVRDFQNGLDLLEISSGAEKFADLAIRQSGTSVHIAFADTEVFLDNTSVVDISGADFIFT